MYVCRKYKRKIKDERKEWNSLSKLTKVHFRKVKIFICKIGKKILGNFFLAKVLVVMWSLGGAAIIHVTQAAAEGQGGEGVESRQGGTLENSTIIIFVST